MNFSARTGSSSTSTSRWLIVGLLVLLTIVSIGTTRKALQSRGAFQRWLPQISDLDQGVDISQRYSYPNPPIMALLLYPLVKLPVLLQSCGCPVRPSEAVAGLSWFWIKVLLTLLALRWAFMLAQTGGRPMPLWAQVVAVLLSLRPIMGDLSHGNVNLFILFLVLASLAAFRRGFDLRAGLLLGLAIACKLTPALFLPYLAWKRAWHMLAGSVLGLALFLWPGYLPALVLGWDANQQQVHSWYRDMVHPFVVEGKVTSEHNNQSLPGLFTRLLTHSPSFSTYVENRYTPTHYDNWLDLSPRTVSYLVKGCLVLFVLLVVLCCRTRIARRSSGRLAIEYSMILLGMLLFSERTWKHHCVMLVLPFAVLCSRLAHRGTARPLRMALTGLLVLAALLMAATSTTLQGEGGSPLQQMHQLFAKKAQVYGAYVWVYAFLLVGLAAIARRWYRAARLGGSDAEPGPSRELAARSRPKAGTLAQPGGADEYEGSGRGEVVSAHPGLERSHAGPETN